MRLKRFEVRWKPTGGPGVGAKVSAHLKRSVGVWKITGPGVRGDVFHYKKNAVESAVRRAKLAQPSQLFICKKDGTYQEERTYPRSRDPRRSPG